MKRLIIALCVLAIAGLAVFWFLTEPSPAVARQDFAALDKAGDAGRGKIIFHAGGCASCHVAPGEPDHLKLGGGLGLPSPFGTFYVPNISPDPKDGIGSWSAGDLANAMLSGVSPKGEHYFPAFPFTTYAHAKLGDIADLMAFLKTLPPVAGKVRPHDVPFPFSVRRALGMWKLLFLDRSPVVADAGHDASWNRGHYLVEALGHCAECHSPRYIIGGIIPSQRLAGGPNPEGKGWVPNITQDATGLAKWSAKDIVEVLTTGFTPDYDAVGGSMASVVRNMAQLPEADRTAIAAYLKALPAVVGPARPQKVVR